MQKIHVKILQKGAESSFYGSEWLSPIDINPLRDALITDTKLKDYIKLGRGVHRTPLPIYSILLNFKNCP
jgi:hypothetical protein